MEKTKKDSKFKKTMIWVGIILAGLSGIVLFGGDKVTSGILLVVTMLIMIIPARQNKTLRLVRIGFVRVVFALVAWNISTTNIPSDPGILVIDGKNSIDQADAYSTGCRFMNQLIHIFKGFLEGRVFHSEPISML